ncbi:MAG: acyl--CoA ligase, partial [Rhodanobacteraceae bacterium]|nr:acyl--CoA ligase [Rhodanobacteraceae bacterium]
MYFEWKDLTLNKSFAYACRTWGERTAIVHGDRQYSYARLQREVFELAQGLRELGVTKGTRVSYLLTNGAEWACFLYAVFSLGAIAVPLNLTWVGREIEQGLKLTDAEILVMADELRGKNLVDIVRGQFPELQDSDGGQVRIERLPHLRRIVTCSATGKKYAFSADFNAVKALGQNFDAAQLRELADQIEPDDACSYMLTSGSTAFPKPAIHSHNSILFNVANMADCHDLRTTDRILHFAPTYHVAGVEIFLLAHLRGATIYLMDYFEPEWAMRTIEAERITLMWGFDVHYLMMRRHRRYALYDISSLDRALIGNSPGTYEEIKSMGIPHHGNIYGSTENGGAHAQFPYRHRDDEKRKKSSNGLALSYVDTKIVDPETGERLPVNEMGEICSRGPGLFKGYYNMPAETAAVMDQEGYYHSGDYGWVDEKGFVYYRGRIKDTVKTGGENVPAREVEVLLEGDTPWVNTAIVVGVPDAQWGEAVTAMVELKVGASVDVQELKSY